ncbi:MAG: hypothetical protein Q7S14_02635 [bacterium]|nr:hypothetical protein [bacterium]
MSVTYTITKPGVAKENFNVSGVVPFGGEKILSWADLGTSSLRGAAIHVISILGRFRKEEGHCSNGKGNQFGEWATVDTPVDIAFKSEVTGHQQPFNVSLVVIEDKT